MKKAGVVERQEIEVFLALADELHFARTAERLHVSAALVSQTISKLERRFGAPLFARTTRRVELTELGQQLLGDLRPAHTAIQVAIARATATGHGVTGHLDIGYMSAAAADRLLPLVDTFREATPGCEVDIRETALADLFGPLRRAEVDVSVLPLPVDEDDLTVGPVLLREPAMLAVPTGHALADRSAVTAEDLAGETLLFVQDLPDYWVAHHSPVPSPSLLTLPGFQEILAYVGAGRGVAIVGEQTAHLYPRPGMVCVPLAGDLTLSYAVVWRTGRLSALAEAFVSSLG